jgi:hypothetical protein
MLRKVFYRLQNTHILLNIKIKPNASQNRCLAIKEEYLEVAIHAKPHDNEANRALVVWLAEFLSVPKSSIELLKGHKSRYKLLQLPMSTELIECLENCRTSK